MSAANDASQDNFTETIIHKLGDNREESVLRRRIGCQVAAYTISIWKRKIRNSNVAPVTPVDPGHLFQASQQRYLHRGS